MFGVIGQDWSSFTDAGLWVLPDQDVRVSLSFSEHDGDVWMCTWGPLKTGEWSHVVAPLSSFRFRDDISVGDGVMRLNGVGEYWLTVCPVASSKDQHMILFDNLQLTK